MLKEIKSRLILKHIFGNIKKKLKLKIIKLNKNLMDKLNIGIKDFKIYQLLKEFNKAFNQNIKDNDIEKLVIKDENGENINRVIYYIAQIGFHELKELSLINTIKQMPIPFI